jgi:hypothetical protein
MISLDVDHDMSKGSGTYMGNMLLEAYDVTSAFVCSRAQLLIYMYWHVRTKRGGEFELVTSVLLGVVLTN